MTESRAAQGTNLVVGCEYRINTGSILGVLKRTDLRKQKAAQISLLRTRLGVTPKGQA